MPPQRFTGSAAAVAVFTDPAGVGDQCDNLIAIACVVVQRGKPPLVALPNPCPLATREIYAAIVCHELGHLNGWPATHGG